MAVSREYFNLSNDELRALALSQRGNAEALNKISLELSFRSSRSARRLAAELPQLVTGEAETGQEQDLEPGPAPAQEVAQQRCKPRGTWETTPPEIMQALFVNGVDYDEQELQDLGWPDIESPFKRDTTLEEFHAQEAVFRRSQPLRELGWWDTSASRSQAWWRLRTRPDPKEELGRWDATLKALGYRQGGGGSPPVTLLWLLSCSESSLDTWRAQRREHEQLLSRLSNWIDDRLVDITAELPAGFTIEELVNERSWQLGIRARQVLFMRYGLSGYSAATLEDVGRALGVSRERVRQIQTKLSASLTHDIDLTLARRLLVPAVDRISGAPRVLRANQQRSVLKELEPLEQFLVDALGQGLDQWLLDEIGLLERDRFLIGVRAHAEAYSTAELINEFEAPSKAPIPLQLHRFKQLAPSLGEMSATQIEAALPLSRRYSLERGFVLSAARPQAERDAIEVWHRIHDAGGYVSLQYLGSRPLADCSDGPPPDYLRRDRDACQGHKHLFMRIRDDGVLALGPRADLLDARPPASPTDPYPWSPSPTGSVAFIEAQLHSLTIARLSEIRIAVEQASSGAIPHGTTHGLISIRTDRFLRVTPGTYAVRGTDLLAHEERLVNKHQIQLYLEARKAGEASDAYPGWTPSLELKWCRWARAHQPQQYRELLHFCAISEWPDPEEGVTWWSDQQERLSRAPSTRQAHPTSAPRPLDFDELLEMMCMIALDGGINQQRINRSLGMRPEISTEWAYLAALTAAGFVQDGQPWLNWHAAAANGPLADASRPLRGALLEERMQTGRVREDGHAAQAFRESATDGLRDNRCSWLNGSARAALIEELQRGPISYAGDGSNPQHGAATSLDQMLLEMEAEAGFDLLNEVD